MEKLKKELNPNIKQIYNALKNTNINNIFYVASGGSLAVMYPTKYFLDSYTKNLSSDCYNSDEFVYRNPKKLSNDSLVILCSQTGTTKETVNASKFANDHGATTIGLTVDTESPLAKEVDFIIEFESRYTTGIPINSFNSNYSLLYQLNSILLRLFDDVDKVNKLVGSLYNIQNVIDKAKSEYQSYFNKFAKIYEKEKVIYTMASGSNYGAAYSFAICVLMEMQWIHSHAIHSGEFFHGPFEVFDDEVPFILFMSKKETREIDKRAYEFLKNYGDINKIMVIDSKDFNFNGIDEEFEEFLTPLISFDILWDFAYLLAEKREHPMLTSRRYMNKVKY